MITSITYQSCLFNGNLTRDSNEIADEESINEQAASQGKKYKAANIILNYFVGDILIFKIQFCRFLLLVERFSVAN